MRLSKITTRTGDDGTTGLADGTRVAKDCARITCHRQRGRAQQSSWRTARRNPAGRLHDRNCCGSRTTCSTSVPYLPHPARLRSMPPNSPVWMRPSLTTMPDLPPLKEFILPGGTRAAALCHVARSVARRAERDLLHLMHGETVPQEGLRYLNRLSDLLFVLSRTLNRSADTR